MNDVETQVIWRGARAKILADRGYGEAAESLAREAVETASATTDGLLKADALVDLAMVFSAGGRPDSAGPPVREALRLLEAKGDRASASALRARFGAIVA